MQFLVDSWKKVPPLTRTLLLISVLLSLLVTLELVSPLKLYLNWTLVWEKNQYWRLVTCLFYKGELSPHTVFDFYLFFRYSSMLEQGAFRNRPADYMVFFLFGCSQFVIWAIVLGL